MTSSVAWLRRRPRRAIVVLGSLALLLLLAGCVGATDVQVTLQDGERWQLETRLTLSSDELALYGGADGFEEYIATAMEMQVGMGLEQLEESCNWRSERQGDDYCLVVSCEGQGWSKLGSLSGLTVQTVEEGKLHVTYGPVYGGRSHTFRLTGGRIETSNADEVKGGTAVWYNLVGAGQARATVTEARRRRLPCCPSTLGLGALLVPLALALGRGHWRV